eukprot:gene27090-33765_t
MLNSHSLRELKIVNCPLISDQSFSTMGKLRKGAVPLLTHLSISGCSGITDKGFSPFATKHCGYLESFSLHYCRVSMLSMVAVLTTAGATLTKFSSYGCTAVTEIKSVVFAIASATALSKRSALSDFTLNHTLLVNVETAVALVDDWLPQLTEHIECTGSALRLRVEQPVEGVDEFT